MHTHPCCYTSFFSNTKFTHKQREAIEKVCNDYHQLMDGRYTFTTHGLKEFIFSPPKNTK